MCQLRALPKQVADLPTSFLPTRFRIGQLQIKFAEQRWDKLAHLHPANIPAQAYSCATAEGEEEAVHVRSVSFKPPLRSESLDVFPKDFLIAMHDPGVDSDNRSGGQELAVNLVCRLLLEKR